MQYDVYAIGNALVDSEFQVEDSFLRENNIEKGLMTLVDQERLDALEKALTERSELQARNCGGSAGNTLFALSKFGGSSFLSCKVANDAVGQFYSQQMTKDQIHTNKTSSEKDGKTGRCLIMVSPDAERTMNTHLGVSDSIASCDLEFSAAKNAKYIYIEGYLVTSPSAREALLDLREFAKKNNIKTAMTFSDPSMVEYFPKEVNEVLSDGVDLLFCNEQELKIWAKTENLESGLEKLRMRAKQFVVTLGSKGAIVFDGNQLIEIDACHARAVDTNGAGDMFAGAMLYGITHGLSLKQAGNLASLASSEVVSQFGSRLPEERHLQLLDIVKTRR
ncbi:MAG: adenosine kinase [Gammaproteobacteria bacterium]|nr:adenosine kinase [Gammaproteobacteria bacterium]